MGILVCVVCVIVAMFLPLYLQASALPAAAVALASMGWAFQARCAGDLSLAYGLFFACGAYSAVVFSNMGATAWVGVLAGMLTAALIATAISLATHRYRIRGVYYTFASLAVNLGALYVVESTGFLGGVSGTLLEAPVNSLAALSFGTDVMLVIVIVLIFVLGGVLVILERSRWGHIWRALREDEDAAASLGVDVRRFKVGAAAIGAAVAAIGGSLSALALALVAPESVLEFSISISILVGAVFGGTAKWWFAPAGAALIGVGPELVASNVSGLPDNATTLVYGVALMLVVYLFPDGIFGFRRRGRRVPAEPSRDGELVAASEGGAR